MNFASDAMSSLTGLGGGNFTAVHTSLSMFVCPTNVQSTSLVRAQTNYAGNGGYGLQAYGTNGLFWNASVANFNQSIGAQAVTDGTSQTLGMIEWVVGQTDDLASRDPSLLTFTVPDFGAPGQYGQLVRACADMSPITDPMSYGKLAEWVVGEYGYTLLNASLPPDGNSCIVSGEQVGFAIYSAGSKHNHGVNAAFVDGHVSFIKDTIDLATWRGLSTKANGEIVSNY